MVKIISVFRVAPTYIAGIGQYYPPPSLPEMCRSNVNFPRGLNFSWGVKCLKMVAAIIDFALRGISLHWKLLLSQIKKLSFFFA